MAKKDSYEERAEALLAPIVAANSCEIYDVEYVKEGSDWYLRAYIGLASPLFIIQHHLTYIHSNTTLYKMQ